MTTPENPASKIGYHRGSAAELADLIRSYNPTLVIEPIPSRISRNALKYMLEQRRLIAQSLSLGVPVFSGERKATVEARTLEMLPAILHDKGLISGATVLLGPGYNQPDEPHLIVRGLESEEELRDTVAIRLHAEGSKAYATNAIKFAVNAILVTTSSTIQ